MPNPRFGSFTGRPGGEPPPRRQLSPEELRVRETFNRQDHLAGKTAPSNPQPDATTGAKAFDEPSIRAALLQEGLDFAFQIFPIGEKPPVAGGFSQRLQGRIDELESERAVIKQRMLVAEQVAADAVREFTELKSDHATLLKELETLKSPEPQEAT